MLAVVSLGQGLTGRSRKIVNCGSTKVYAHNFVDYPTEIFNLSVKATWGKLCQNTIRPQAYGKTP